MISNIKGRTTQDIFDGVNSKAARVLDPKLHQRARDLLDALNAITDPSDLKTPPSNRLHRLKHDLKEYWSISINDKWRIIFKWENGMAVDVEIIDYH